MKNRAGGLLLAVTSACAASPAPAPPGATSPPASSMTPAADTKSAPPVEQRLDVHGWRVIERESGPDNYYAVVDDPAMPYIQSRYRPPFKTTVLGYELDEAARASAIQVRWKWRAVTLPKGGDECVAGKGDSAAVVYLTWKRGLRYYTLKYVWSAVGTKGAVCGKKRSPFVAQDTIVLESGDAGTSWKSEEVDLKKEFRNHFESGSPSADVPGFLGIGIMSDGDQTESESAADYADFVIRRPSGH